MFELSPAEAKAANGHSTCQGFIKTKLSAVVIADVVTAINAMILRPGDNLGPLKYLLNLRDILQTSATGRQLIQGIQPDSLGMQTVIPTDATPYATMGTANKYVRLIGILNNIALVKSSFIMQTSDGTMYIHLQSVLASSYAVSASQIWHRGPIYGGCSTGDAGNKLIYETADI